jgi:peptide/nickel transport system permease protein
MRLPAPCVLEVLRQDYVRTAWAKGLREARESVLTHSLKNALIPWSPSIGIQLAQIFSGTSSSSPPSSSRGWPLPFRRHPAAGLPGDPGHQPARVSIIVLMNLLVDLLYAVLDPRIRYS